ncbi:hypothetical protein B0H16DRAFT_1568656 [Mycena metata]|uniref:BTB domain-containing protein n=1 Tax=Mycena metata TaxID=1033252 RepID=A0AAD7MZQ5_9AGAR|nr:hypothetical protein B0H16DRAFT_1568656 [Mycena metata]
MSDPALDSADTPRVSFSPTYPFDNAPAETILRSSDGAEFYVHHAILSLVSPGFKTIFQLPQPETSPAIPVIDVDEVGALLDRMLPLFYPATQPATTTMDELRDTIQVALMKYDMHVVAPSIKQQVREWVSSDPLAVYALAVQHHWNDLAVAAAKESLKHPIRIPTADTPSALRHLSAAAHHKLLHYHYQCAISAQTSVTTIGNLRWVPNEFVWFNCTKCSSHNSIWYLADGISHRVQKWFTDFLAQVGEVLLVTPVTNILESKCM